MMVSYKQYGSRPDCPFRRSLVKTLSVCYRDGTNLLDAITEMNLDKDRVIDFHLNMVFYFLPLFDRPKINIVFSNTLKVRSCIANQIYNSKLFFREKETKHRFCLECRFCFRFSTLLLFTYDKYKNKIDIYNKFFLFVLPHCLSIIPA